MESDRELLRAIAQHNRQALHLLYERHGLALLNHLIGLTSDRALAEEILQDVMLAVWQRADSFQEKSSVKTWLFAIARRQAWSHQRRQQPEMMQLNEEQVTCYNHHDVYQEEYSDLVAAIKQLPANQQEALDLIYYRGLSSVQAAERLQISVNTFRSRLQRARHTLKRLLGATP